MCFASFAMTLGELLGPDAPPLWRSIEITGLTADSREVKPGFLFAALPGTQTDGGRFVADVVKRGAAALLLPQGAGTLAGEIPAIEDEEPRRKLALLAARFFGAQPETAVAVTGTNGKTSVAAFTRQLWEKAGLPAASLGTIGIVRPSGTEALAHTTPDPAALQRILAGLAEEGITHLALEASSHGLEQHRLDGVRLASGAFTNISRDHLDYHPSFEEYFAAKMRLFSELLPAGSAAVIEVDSEAGRETEKRARWRGLQILSVGAEGKDLALKSTELDGFAQRLTIEHAEGTSVVRLPLVGGFQASNALVAAGLCLATGERPSEVLPRLETLRGARGRLDLAGEAASGAPIFIDYAHTPDALEKALLALRPYVKDRLTVVFGCGGDRDRGKRPQMGAAATAGADLVFVTDDNPRSEEPEAIRQEILAGAPGAVEIAGRGEAIAEAIAGLKGGDILLIAGKGHETGQIVKGRVMPYSDHDAVSAALRHEAAKHG